MDKDVEIRVNAMMNEYRNTFIQLSDRNVALAAELAVVKAELENIKQAQQDGKPGQ